MPTGPMTDLHCPATLIVARHGEAIYDVPGIASDDGGWLSDLGRRQAAALAEELASRRVAGIWCSDLSRAVQTAEIVAARLGLPVKVRSGLREAQLGGYSGLPDVGELFDKVYLRWLDGDLTAAAPLAETGADVVRRMTVELEAAADEFRGETLLVVSHGGAMSVTLPLLASNVSADYARGRPLHNCATCEVTADADGWRLQTWAGTPV